MPPSGHLPQTSACPSFRNTTDPKISQKQSYCEITHLDKFSVFKWDSCTQFVKLPTQSTLYYKKYYVLRSYKSKKGDFHIFSKWPALEQFRRPIKVLDNALMSQPRYTPRDYWFYLFRTPVYRELETGSTNQFFNFRPSLNSYGNLGSPTSLWYIHVHNSFHSSSLHYIHSFYNTLHCF